MIISSPYYHIASNISPAVKENFCSDGFIVNYEHISQIAQVPFN